MRRMHSKEEIEEIVSGSEIYMHKVYPYADGRTVYVFTNSADPIEYTTAGGPPRYTSDGLIVGFRTSSSLDFVGQFYNERSFASYLSFNTKAGTFAETYFPSTMTDTEITKL